MAVTTVVTTLSLVCVFVTSTLAAPPKKTFDQRQQGELNIHAQLDNIVVVVIPSAKLNLLDLGLDNKLSGEKGGFFQLLQKLHKAEIDRYDTIKGDEEQLQADTVVGEPDIDINGPVPVVTSSQQVSFNHNEKDGDKEEEVIATVEEMKPNQPLRPAEQPKSEATEDSPIKEQSTVSEEESVQKKLTLSTNEAETTQKESSVNGHEEKKSTVTSQQQDKVKPNVDLEKDTIANLESSKPPATFAQEPPTVEEPAKIHKTKVIATSPKEDGSTIEDYIKPVAAKEEITPASSATKKTFNSEELTVSLPKKTVGLQEGVRKEKVIRYKPEAKWAPELVDLLGPTKPKPKELQERQLFADLCSPGVWDSELRTCIMPGETRRGELARFLDAMRFGIALPK